MTMHLRWAVVATLAGTLAFGGCEPDPRETQINARIKSPDGKLEAVYAEDLGGGPAVGVTEEVFVVERGAFPRLNERVFSEECVHNLSLAWDDPHALPISYDLSSDIRDDVEVNRPSIFSIFSRAYWTYSPPHGAWVYLVRRVTPPGSGC